MHATNRHRFLLLKATTDTEFQEHIGCKFLIVEDKVDDDVEVDADDSGYFSDGELSTTDLEEMDDDDFFCELETNDDMDKTVKHYETLVKPLAAPLLESILKTPTNAEEKEATDISDDVGGIKIDSTLAVKCDEGVRWWLQQLSK